MAQAQKPSCPVDSSWRLLVIPGASWAVLPDPTQTSSALRLIPSSSLPVGPTIEGMSPHMLCAPSVLPSYELLTVLVSP